MIMVILIAKLILFLVTLREKWHTGSKAKYEAKKAKIEAYCLEHQLKCWKRLNIKPARRKAKFIPTFKQHNQQCKMPTIQKLYNPIKKELIPMIRD